MSEFGETVGDGAASEAEVERDSKGRLVPGQGYVVEISYEQLSPALSSSEALKRLRLLSAATAPLSEIVALRDRAGIDL